MSSGECVAIGVIRKRELPAGTVGGRIAWHQNPWLRNVSANVSEASALPVMSGTMAVRASPAVSKPADEMASRTIAE